MHPLQQSVERFDGNRHFRPGAISRRRDTRPALDEKVVEVVVVDGGGKRISLYKRTR